MVGLRLEANPRRRAKLLTTSILAVGGLVLLAMWLLVVASIQQSRDAAVQRARSNGANLTAALGEEVTHTLDGVDGEMEIIAERMRTAGSDMNIYRWAHETPLLSRGEVQGSIIGPDGKLVSTTVNSNFDPVDLSDRAHFRVHLDGNFKGLYVSQPVVGRVSKVVTLQISKRVDARDGRFLGVLVYSILPAYFTDLPQTINLGANGVVGLIGLDNVVRARFSKAHLDGFDGVGQIITDHPLPSEIPENGEGFYVRSSSFDGVTRIIAYRRIQKYPLVVDVGLDLDDVLAEPKSHEVTSIALAAVATLLLGGLGAFLIRESRDRARRELELAAERTKIQTANDQLSEKHAKLAAMNEELTRSRENMARAQQVAGLGSFERNIVTGTNEWSDELYRIMGVEKGIFAPSYEAVLALVHPDDRERYAAARVAGVEGTETGALEFRIIRPDGGERVIRRENRLMFDEHGKPIRIYGSYQDITERRSAEERERALERRLMHSQKLEALGTLAGGIAHDLNNTLTPIMALSKVTARRLEAGGKDRENLETIFAASEQARDLVKRVLAFSRREKIEKKPAKLRAIVDDALQLLRATIPTSIELDARINEVPPILADASQIHQVVTNLVTNAAQAIGNGMGVITVTLDMMVGSARERKIRLSVTDTGEGMDDATRQRIFEPFFTTKLVGHGTGLGLSIIEAILADHGGRIEVESTPGKGARFDLYFPLADAQASTAA